MRTTSAGMIPAALMTALALLLTGCGSSGGGANAEDETAIETLLVRHYASPSCDDLTDAGRRSFGHPVEDGACEQDLASQKRKKVSVSDVSVDGDRATAVADDYTFDLRRVDGGWLIDGGSS